MSRDDPVFAAIHQWRKLYRKCNRFSIALDEAESRARKKHGVRPFGLIVWRNYHIGGSEIDRVRDQLLNDPDANKKQIAKEYRDAKERYAAEIRAMRDWDERAGILSKREELERLIAAERRAEARLARTKPTTPAGAGAMIRCVLRDIDVGEAYWQMPALRTAAAALARM